MLDGLTMQVSDGNRPLPEGWRWARVGEVCDRIDYGFTARADFEATGPRLLRITDIQNGRVNWDNVPGCQIDTAQEKTNALADGDIVFARTGATTGKSLLLKNPPRSVFASYLIRLRPRYDILPEYLYSYFQSSEYWRQIHSSARGGAQPNVNASLLTALVLPLPPYDEQRRIAAILNEQMAAVERARAAAKAQLEAAKALPAAYLRAVFDSPEAKQWPMRTLAEISKLLPSKSITTNGDAEVQAITTACLSESGFLESGIKQARMLSKDVSECIVRSGEVLVARSNTPDLVGRVAMFPGVPPGVVASDLTIRIWPTNGITSGFLAAYLSFLYQSGYWRERAGGASGSMKKITRQQIQTELIPVPEPADQQHTVAELGDQMTSVNPMRETIETELEAINKLPAALLHRAFNGELSSK